MRLEKILKYNNEEEKEEILKKNADLFFTKQLNLIDGNYLFFTDEEIEYIPSIEEVVKEQGNKISILETENETLKQELSITQDAVNELIFNSLNV